MHIVFYSTNDVFKAEELLNEADIDCDIVPTPVLDKAYCGVCLKVNDSGFKEVLGNLEYEIV